MRCAGQGRERLDFCHHDKKRGRADWLAILPDVTFDQAHEAPDVIIAPGGIVGTLNAVEDDETIAFLADQGAKARYVTSVCTGAMLIGQAGLLEGYRAATHWLAMPVMDAFGAEAIDARVVRDRNRITGGGVTAGLDFGLTVAEELRGTQYAQLVQLFAEYAPEPPLDAGRWISAPQAVRDQAAAFVPGFEAHARAVASLRE